jgi:hypothetical protein
MVPWVPLRLCILLPAVFVLDTNTGHTDRAIGGKDENSSRNDRAGDVCLSTLCRCSVRPSTSMPMKRASTGIIQTHGWLESFPVGDMYYDRFAVSERYRQQLFRPARFAS